MTEKTLKKKQGDSWKQKNENYEINSNLSI